MLMRRAGESRSESLYSHRVLIDDEFAAIVTTFTANCVIDMPSAAVGADGECRDESFVVSTTFRGSGMRLSAFRMCHFSMIFLCYYFYVWIGSVKGRSREEAVSRAHCRERRGLLRSLRRSRRRRHGLGPYAY